MPIQKKKKKKPKPKSEKTPAVSQKVSQVVKINIGDVKPKPRRRAAPRKPPAGGGGRGGFPPAPPSGLTQVVQAPQVTQDVLQQSKELREIVNKLQTSPAQQTLRGQEEGGQPENPLNPRAFVTRQELDDRSEMNLQRQAAAQFNIYQKIRDVERGLLESYAMEEARRDEDMSDVSSQTGSLAGFTMAETVKTKHSHALDPNIPEAAAAEVHEPDQPPVAQLVPGAGRGRGAGLTEDERQMIRDDIVASGMTVNAYNMSGRNPIGTGPISKNTLNSLFRPFGGLKGYKERQGI